MTTYVVGPGGNDNNSGRTWATRLLTLNGAEDKPVAPGDLVYVAPGVYREELTVDVSGAAGRPITYIADVTGEHTDGVGGYVRVTGSDDDQTGTRNECIIASDKDYRTFRGFTLDTPAANQLINTTDDCTHWIVEDCVFENGVSARSALRMSGACTDWIIRRCVFFLAVQHHIEIVHTSELDDANHLIENCLFLKCRFDNVNIIRVGDSTIRNCTFMAPGDDAIDVQTSPNVGHGWDVNNCIFVGAGGSALEAVAVGDIVENYNTFYGNVTDRTNVNVGANSQTYPPLFEGPLLTAGDDLLSGFRLPWWMGSLLPWSQVAQITGSGEATTDLYGQRRPYTHGGPIASLCSWGAVQWYDFRRSDVRSYDGSLSALVRKGQKTQMFVPGVSATQTTISARAWRTAGYGGHRNPTMVIKQSGQDDRTTILGGAAGAWVQGSDTFTPAADPPWLVVELWNHCDFTTTTTVSTTSTTTQSTTSTTTQTVSTLTTTTTTLPCDVWWDDLQVA